MSFIDKRNSLDKMISNVSSQSRHSIRNAWRCIDRARTLQSIDPEMSLFRAITAEEEASTALIKIIKERKYDNSKHLNTRSHLHKNIVFFVIKLASDHFKDLTEKANIKVFPDGFDQNKLQLKIIMPGLPEGIASEPIPPLNFHINKDEESYKFQDELKFLVSNGEIEKISSFIKEQANFRNLLLYANDKGMPSVKADNLKYIHEREKRVYVMTIVYLFIAQHYKKQNLVQQCVDTAQEISQKVNAKE